MKILIIFTREPYGNMSVDWNGLRLADSMLQAGQEVRIFLMGDAVDMDRDVSDQDLPHMLEDLIAKGVAVRVCGASARDGIYKKHPYFEGTEMSSIPELAEWVIDSDRVLTF